MQTEGQRPDQMVALRFYISERIIVSTRRRRVPAVDEIMQDLAKNMGPLNTADWLVDLCEHITEQAGDFIDELQEKIAVLEEHLLSERTMDRVDLADIRRQLIVSRRYLAPQRICSVVWQMKRWAGWSWMIFGVCRRLPIGWGVGWRIWIRV